MSNGRSAVLEADEEPLAPVALSAGLDHVAALSAKERLLVLPVEEMRDVRSGRGVIIMRLDRGEKLIAVALTTSREVVVVLSKIGTKADSRMTAWARCHLPCRFC